MCRQVECASSAGFTASSSIVTLRGVGVQRAPWAIRTAPAMTMTERRLEDHPHTEWYQSWPPKRLPMERLSHGSSNSSLRNEHLADYHAPVCRQASPRSRTVGARGRIDAEGLEMAWWLLAPWPAPPFGAVAPSAGHCIRDRLLGDRIPTPLRQAGNDVLVLV